MTIKFDGGAHVKCDGCGVIFFRGGLRNLEELVLAATNIGKFTSRKDKNGDIKHNCPECEKKAKGGQKK
ncbi:MAG: hypothetical protein WCT26_02135 [Candidatus Buchananbacteria bacterium]|jgi:hypothetical protein